MAMKTWQVPVKWDGQKTLHKFKCAEADANHLNSKLSSLTGIERWSRALEGWKDEPGTLAHSYRTVLFGDEHNTPPDPAQWRADTAALLARLPQGEQVGDGKLAKALAAEAARLFMVHLPILDERKDRDEEAVRQQAAAQATLEREARAAAERAEFAQAWARDDRVLPIPDGMQAIVLTLNYDGSDMMSDYWAPHMPLPGSAPLLLQWAGRTQPQTEKLAREALAHYPQLGEFEETRYDGPDTKHQPITWEWHTEKWSMGHGNYLQSGIIFEFELNPGPYAKTVAVHLEVEFSSYPHDKILAYKHYRG